MLQSLRRSRRPTSVRTTRVRVRGGYEPDTIYGRVGEPLRLMFRREETAPCSERVVFPAFGKSAMLPAVPGRRRRAAPHEPGAYEFTCQMGVLHGTLVVEGDGGGAR